MSASPVAEKEKTVVAAVPAPAERASKGITHIGSGLGRGKIHGSGLSSVATSATKRHKKKVLRDNIGGITGPALRRLARRGGSFGVGGLA